MPYIPEAHKKYDLLPLCQKDGGEVFEYPGELIYKAEKEIGEHGLMPYNFESYGEYYAFIDSLIEKHSNNPNAVALLAQVKQTVLEMNQKEEWSILRYLGPSDDGPCGLTHGKIYYWPSRKTKPVYSGVVDDEEFTSYLYPTDAELWEILEDPTGMAYQTIYKNGEGAITQAEHAKMMAQVGEMLKNTEDTNGN